MARQVHNRDITPTLAAAEQWVNNSLIENGSLFSEASLWTTTLADEVHHAFVDHPDFGKDDFMTKLKGQMKTATPLAQQLMAEMLWALLLFPSNMKARTKRQQVREIWALSGQQLPEDIPLMRDPVLVGIGSGGPGFNNYRPDEMTFLIALTRDLKRRTIEERRRVLTNYEAFIGWIDRVPQQGSRQFRHMLRFFAFPERVERISSNNNRRRILQAFGIAQPKETNKWTDRQLDDALLKLRADLQGSHPSGVLDFYSPDLKDRWSPSRKIKTIEGEVTVTVPRDDEEEEDKDFIAPESKTIDVRQSLQVQAKLAEIGTAMGFRIWIPRSDRGRVRELVPQLDHGTFLDDLPLSYDQTTLDTIEQIDVLWFKRRSIARAFEVEHTTAVYSGLLRMADLLALQPNMDIRLHIVAPDERREKVFREMLRPVFSLLDRGPLSRSCTFISYESVDSIRGLEHLAHTNDSIIAEYEEPAEAEA
jgi:hypothetical protein